MEKQDTKKQPAVDANPQEQPQSQLQSQPQPHGNQDTGIQPVANMGNQSTQMQPVPNITRKAALPSKTVAGLFLAVCPYLYSIYTCAPCILNPGRCTWAEGFVFAYLLSFLAVPLNITSLVLGIKSLTQSEKHQDPHKVKVLSVVIIVLSILYFAANFLMVDLVHMLIKNAGGY